MRNLKFKIKYRIKLKQYHKLTESLNKFPIIITLTLNSLQIETGFCINAKPVYRDIMFTSLSLMEARMYWRPNASSFPPEAQASPLTPAMPSATAFQLKFSSRSTILANSDCSGSLLPTAEKTGPRLPRKRWFDEDPFGSRSDCLMSEGGCQLLGVFNHRSVGYCSGCPQGLASGGNPVWKAREISVGFEKQLEKSAGRKRQVDLPRPGGPFTSFSSSSSVFNFPKNSQLTQKTQGRLKVLKPRAS